MLKIYNNTGMGNPKINLITVKVIGKYLERQANLECFNQSVK